MASDQTHVNESADLAEAPQEPSKLHRDAYEVADSSNRTKTVESHPEQPEGKPDIEYKFGTVELFGDLEGAETGKPEDKDPQGSALLKEFSSENLGERFQTMVEDGTLIPRLREVTDNGNMRAIARRFADLPSDKLALGAKALRMVDPMWTTQMKLAFNGVSAEGANFDREANREQMTPYRPTDAWTGSGITGVNPSEQPEVSLLEMAKIGFDRKVTNYFGAEGKYDDTTITPPEFISGKPSYALEDRARLFLEAPISTTTPEAYAGNIPSRAEVIRAAGELNGVDPRIVTGFLLAEQQHQTANEDALDFLAAARLGKNTSIGVAQITLENGMADEGALLSDTVDPTSRRWMSTRDAATYLASDEHAIFAAAKFIRQTANEGARVLSDPNALPKTRERYPDMDFSALAKNSSHWTYQHVALLGSEYTSTAWDDDLHLWGGVVAQFTRVAVDSGIFSK